MTNFALYLYLYFFQVESSLAQTQRHVAHMDTQIHSIEVQAGLIVGELETKASLAALRECVTRRHYEQAVAALGAELELKCTHTTVSKLQSDLQVQAHLAIHKFRAD